MSDRLDPRRWCSRRRWRSRPGLLFGLFPALHSTRPDLVTGDQEHGRPAVRRPRRLALPDRPGDHADRALDDAADPRRALHQEPDEHQPRRPGHRRPSGSSPSACRPSATATRRSDRRRCSSGSRTSSPRCPASAAPPRRWCRCSPATTGATASRCRASPPDRTPTPARCTTRSAPATSAPSACGSSPAATSPAATSTAGPRWRSSTRRSRASSGSTGHVVGSRMASENGNGVKLDIEIVGLVKDAKYSEVKREIPPVFFTPVPAGRRRRRDDVLRAHARSTRRRCSRRSRASSPASIRTCRSRICDSMDAAGPRRTSASIA